MKKARYLRKPYRLKKRKSIFRNRFFWLFIFSLIISGGIFYFLIFSDFFQIKEIKISGNEKISNEELQNQIKKEIEQKILFFHTKSIFLINQEQIRKMIFKNFPYVAEVKLKREFPQILEIKIEERKPVANFYANENYFFLDKNGVIFEKIEKPDLNLNFLIIKNLTEDGSPSELGRGMLEKELLSKILEISPKLKDLEISLKEILIISDERINIRTSEGYEIYFDPKKDINWQLTKLKLVLEEKIPQERRKDLEYIELRFGNFAPFKYR